MFPPSQAIRLDADAISGICGSISIACWIVVFSPQVIENFKRGSAEGLSIAFLVIWLSGDVFNILGAVLQGVLPTMIILAVYYTLADVVLLCQCFYYRGLTSRGGVPGKDTQHAGCPNETSRLLQAGDSNSERTIVAEEGQSAMAFEGPDGHTSGTINDADFPPVERPYISKSATDSGESSWNNIVVILYNCVAVLLVCGAGILGWWLSNPSVSDKHENTSAEASSQEKALQFNIWGQIFGYICAALYLGSRIPQLLLNYRRKSTEGISLLFFLFACIGNLTFVLSILVFVPLCENPAHCASGEKMSLYKRYILINFSWLLGSAGTLFLDMTVFVQFFIYRTSAKKSPSIADEREPF